MKTLCALALTGSVLCSIAPPSAGADSTVSGELVVTNAGTNQFRVIDHPGYFQSPSGIPLEALDGKPVIVELSENRRVLSIREKRIHIEPITVGYEVVTGELVLVDTARGTFAIAGAPQTYLAPPALDIRRYAGQRVELLVDDRNQVMQVRPADQPGGALAVGRCSYDGTTYGDSVTLCQTGTQYRCESGTWRSLGVDCGATADVSCVHDGTSYSDGAARCENGVRFACNAGQWRYVNRGCGEDATAAAPSTESCTLGDATLAHDSWICREGVTFHCTNGNWRNVGTACR